MLGRIFWRNSTRDFTKHFCILFLLHKVHVMLLKLLTLLLLLPFMGVANLWSVDILIKYFCKNGAEVNSSLILLDIINIWVKYVLFFPVLGKYFHTLNKMCISYFGNIIRKISLKAVVNILLRWSNIQAFEKGELQKIVWYSMHTTRVSIHIDCESNLEFLLIKFHINWFQNE